MADKSKTDITKPVAWLFGIHIVVLVGLYESATAEIAQRLIPINFIITMAVLLYYQKHWNLRIISYLFFVFFITYIIEMIGAKTGRIFGVIKFGKSLGPKLFETPIMIGLIWLTLIYCAGVMVKGLKQHMLTRALIGTFLIVMVDMLIEPVATKHAMWTWDKNRIPFINYVAWFFITYPLMVLLLNLKAKLRNDIAAYAFCCVAGFFLLANFV